MLIHLRFKCKYVLCRDSNVSLLGYFVCFRASTMHNDIRWSSFNTSPDWWRLSRDSIDIYRFTSLAHLRDWLGLADNLFSSCVQQITTGNCAAVTHIYLPVIFECKPWLVSDWLFIDRVEIKYKLQVEHVHWGLTLARVRPVFMLGYVLSIAARLSSPDTKLIKLLELSYSLSCSCTAQFSLNWLCFIWTAYLAMNEKFQEKQTNSPEIV